MNPPRLSCECLPLNFALALRSTVLNNEDAKKRETTIEGWNSALPIKKLKKKREEGSKRGDGERERERARHTDRTRVVVVVGRHRVMAL
jgi:hypothetical protein